MTRITLLQGLQLLIDSASINATPMQMVEEMGDGGLVRFERFLDMVAAQFAPPAAIGGRPEFDRAAVHLERITATLRESGRLVDEEGEDTNEIAAAAWLLRRASAPINMILHCPYCKLQHVDAPEPENNWPNKPHRSHKCKACGTIWRPADVATNGVDAIATKGTDDNWPLDKNMRGRA
jgi:hypothetical protein